MSDLGEVNFNCDLGTGVVTVSVRPPLGIGTTSATISVLDFLDNAAKITLEINKAQRAMFRELASTQVARKPA